MILPLKQNPPRCKINKKTSIKVKRERFYFSGDFFQNELKIENSIKKRNKSSKSFKLINNSKIKSFSNSQIVNTSRFG